MRWQEYVHQSSDILLGKPVFIGTRISVEMILEEMASGDTEDQIITSYPHLTREHIRAALIRPLGPFPDGNGHREP